MKKTAGVVLMGMLAHDYGFAQELNRAAQNNTATSQSATACIEVVCPELPQPVVHIENDELISDLFPGQNNISSQSFLVDDFVTLTIDVDFTFDNCTFQMGAGSLITVNQNKNLEVHESEFYSCIRMWQGIRLPFHAGIKFKKSVIRDAEIGILVGDESNFNIIDSRFYDCVVGIETENTGIMTTTTGSITGTRFGKTAMWLKAGYAGQPQHGQVGRSGMLLHDITINIGSHNETMNEFFNLNFGIEIHNSNVRVENGRFYDIKADPVYTGNGYYLLKPMGCTITARRDRDNPLQLAVLPLADPNTVTIENTPVGIYTNAYNARITDVLIRNAVRGIKSEESAFNTVQITGCTIDAKFRGIEWMNNDGAINMTAESNSIVITPLANTAKGSACIYMSEINTGNNAHYRIRDNYHLETRSAALGIRALNVENALIDNNAIFTNSSLLPSPGTEGISIEGGARNTITCNSVTNTLPHTNTGTIGININASTNNRIQCNSIGTNEPGSIGPYTGMRFGGDCDISNDVAGNNMKDCPVGLLLNNVARIGPQIHRGNRWNNPQIGNTTAINLNTQNQNYLNSRVWYNPNSGIQFYPNTISPPQWFFPDPTGTTFIGCGTQVCNAALTVGGGDEEHLKAVARDSAISFDYRDENLNQAQQHLYALLLEDSLLRASDSIFQNFFGNKQTAAIGMLQEVKDDLMNANLFLPQQESALALTDSLIKMKLDSITKLDSANVINAVVGYNTIREGLINGMNTLNNVITAIMQQHKAKADSIYAVAEIKNDAVLAAELPETNNKLMNEMVMDYATNGRATVNANYTTLLAVAQQCPYAGGPAVYRARAMLELVDDTLEYYDDAVCLQSGIYRIIQEPMTVTPVFDFNLIPNPASQQVTVELNFTNEEAVRFEIRNVLGGLIKEFVIDKGVQSIVFSVNQFEQGIYFVRVRKDGLTLGAKRLVIIR